CRTSKKNDERGTVRRSSGTSSRLPKRLMVNWNGCGRPSGRSAMASPSRITAATGSPRTASTTSGTRSVMSARFRVNARISPPCRLRALPARGGDPVQGGVNLSELQRWWGSGGRGQIAEGGPSDAHRPLRQDAGEVGHGDRDLIRPEAAKDAGQQVDLGQPRPRLPDRRRDP